MADDKSSSILIIFEFTAKGAIEEAIFPQFTVLSTNLSKAVELI
ncbi:hypothetical protein [Francisella tularensis]|nr:hypothetical protein [Francisella tularensis]